MFCYVLMLIVLLVGVLFVYVVEDVVFVFVVIVVVVVLMLEGEIKKIDIVVGKLIIKYGLFENFGMEFMMMVF